MGVNIEALDAAAAKPVLELDGLDEPVIVESIKLLQKDREHYVHVRSTSGAEGVAFTNGKAGVYAAILKDCIVPYFIGKDARDLEDHLWGVYRQGSNYKMLGQPLWCPVAWVEMAILDMLGRVAGKSMADLLGGAVRDRARFYVASGRRDSTPEDEVEYLQSLVDETHAPAVKFRVGGRMSRNEDASPNRTPRLNCRASIWVTRSTFTRMRTVPTIRPRRSRSGGCSRMWERCISRSRVHSITWKTRRL